MTGAIQVKRLSAGIVIHRSRRSSLTLYQRGAWDSRFLGNDLGELEPAVDFTIVVPNVKGMKEKRNVLKNVESSTAMQKFKARDAMAMS